MGASEKDQIYRNAKKNVIAPVVDPSISKATEHVLVWARAGAGRGRPGRASPGPPGPGRAGPGLAWARPGPGRAAKQLFFTVMGATN